MNTMRPRAATTLAIALAFPDGRWLSNAQLEACNDAQGNVVRAPEYLASLRTAPVDNVSDAATGGLQLVGAGKSKVRLFLKRGYTWTYVTAGTRVTAAELRAGLQLGLDGRDVIREDWDGRVTVRCTVTDGHRISTDEVMLRAAPLLTQHHLQRAEQALVVDGSRNDPNQRKFAREFAKEVRKAIPGVVATVKHVATDGDLVAVHWHASATPANEATGEAKVDLYRVSNGKLVEHWGITQTVPAKTASGNSLFSDEYRYPKGAPTLSEELEEKNRKFAATAYRRLSEGDVTVIDRSWDPRYYQHNPVIANGTGPLKQLQQQDTQDAPSPSSAPDGSTSPTGDGGTRFGNTLSDGDLVWVFRSHGLRMPKVLTHPAAHT